MHIIQRPSGYSICVKSLQMHAHSRQVEPQDFLHAKLTIFSVTKLFVNNNGIHLKSNIQWNWNINIIAKCNCMVYRIAWLYQINKKNQNLVHISSNTLYRVQQGEGNWDED